MKGSLQRNIAVQWRPRFERFSAVSRSLRHGRQMVSIPGPSVMPDRVLAAMHAPMPNIY